MPRSEFSTEGSHPDLANILEQHLLSGFQADLALDLVLNELVIRVAEGTHAASAALALVRGEELVCRAATGNFAPDLGVALNPREGLSGICLRTREPQLSVDTELDPRVAVAFAKRFGIRSVLAVPVFDAKERERCTGVLEVFSPTAASFSRADQRMLEGYSAECSRVQQAAHEMSQRGRAKENTVFGESVPKVVKPVVDNSWLAFPAIPRILPVPDVEEAEVEETNEAKSDSELGIGQLISQPVEAEDQAPDFSEASEVSEAADDEFESESFDVDNGEKSTSESGLPEVMNSDVALPGFLTATTSASSFSSSLLSSLSSSSSSSSILSSSSAPPRRSIYEAWSLVLGTLAIFAIISVSFLIGSRIGWLRATVSSGQNSGQNSAQNSTQNSVQDPSQSSSSAAPVNETAANDARASQTGATGAEPAKAKSISKPVRREPKAAPPEKAAADSGPDAGELVVYEKGKVVFRMKNQTGMPNPQPPPPQSPQSKSASDPNPNGEGLTASATGVAAPPVSTGAGTTRSVWLNPADAEGRLVRRIEPEYPVAARSAHRAGDVVLEVSVAEDGSVASVRTVRGDPVLAAAASQAVRNWRYQPYVLHDHPSQFHTDVTVSFPVSN